MDRERQLFLAGQKILGQLNKRIADAPKNKVPVFRGIADLHQALSLYPEWKSEIEQTEAE